MKEYRVFIFCLVIALILPITSASSSGVYFYDGDSGIVDKIAFRLADIDAPESGNRAQCEYERRLAVAAKKFMQGMAANKNIEISDIKYTDRYGRSIVNITADGVDLAEQGVSAGFLKPWPHDVYGKALGLKPNWCND